MKKLKIGMKYTNLSTIYRLFQPPGLKTEVGILIKWYS